ncbi:MAG: segregation/condensation protein A [Patescibacteria group bacterium]|nr:segregation/condensation protein A [Patescibacteria group bacterium]
MYNVKIPKFEGPLDLLLELIEEQKLDITEMSIAKVAGDYLEFVRSEENISLENLAEFVNIASKIILIKSRSILPTLEVKEDEEKEIKDLEEQLRLYKKFKEAGNKIEFLLKDKKKLYSRDYLLGISSVFAPPKNLNAFDLKKTFQKIIDQIILPEKLPKEAVRDIITLEDKINELQKTLEARVELSFSQMKASAHDKIEVIVSFLALLELVKQRIVAVEQSKIFSEIKISKNVTGDS